MKALPDIVWSWQDRKLKIPSDIDSLVTFLRRIVKQAGNSTFSLRDLAAFGSRDRCSAYLAEWRTAGLIEEDEKGFWRVTAPVFPERPYKELLEDIARNVLAIIRSHFAEFDQPYRTTLPSTHGVPLQDVLDLVYHTAYSLAFDRILSQNPDLTFLHNDGPLRYSGYVILK